MAKVEFHFDFGSPNSYLAHLVIPEIEERTGAKFEYVPVLLGGVFKLTNNRSPAESMAGIKKRNAIHHMHKNEIAKIAGIFRHHSSHQETETHPHPLLSRS